MTATPKRKRTSTSPTGARYILVLVPIRTVSESNQRGAWYGKAARVKKQRSAVCAVLSQHEAPVLPCTVVLERISPRGLDGDNLQSALKACRDEVARWIGVDDRDERVEWNYTQRKGKPKEQAVGIEVIE